MSGKSISIIVALIAIAVVGTLAVLIIKGVFSLAGGVFNLILGIVIVIALVAIVLWMFSYAKAQKNKK